MSSYKIFIMFIGYFGFVWGLVVLKARQPFDGMVLVAVSLALILETYAHHKD